LTQQEHGRIGSRRYSGKKNNDKENKIDPLL